MSEEGVNWWFFTGWTLFLPFLWAGLFRAQRAFYRAVIARTIAETEKRCADEQKLGERFRSRSAN